jgi:hypothetical protein
MSGLQTIIDTCVNLEFDRRRIVASSVSRSQRIRTSERMAAQPFMLSVTAKPVFIFNQSRDLIEDIFTADRFSETEVSLANNPKLNYLVEYRGGLVSQSQAETMTISTWTTNQCVLTTLPTIGTETTTATVLFAKGDYIQPANSRYPYIVTDTVLRGTGSLATATVHRNLINSENINIVGQTVNVGTNTTMRLVVVEMPNYTIYQQNRLNWSGDFKLMEAII